MVNEIDDLRHAYFVRSSLEFCEIWIYDISYIYACCDYG